MRPRSAVSPAVEAKVRGWARRRALLPHSREMAGLLECEPEEVEIDPLHAARRAAERYGAVALVKGRFSFIAAPDGQAFRFEGGGVGLATSGSGDVLAGLVGGHRRARRRRADRDALGRLAARRGGAGADRRSRPGRLPRRRNCPNACRACWRASSRLSPCADRARRRSAGRRGRRWSSPARRRGRRR